MYWEGALGQLNVWGLYQVLPICLQPRAIAPRGGEAAPKECQPRDQGLFKTNGRSSGWGPSVCRRAPRVMSWGHLCSQYSSPGPELGTLPVSTQTPVSELQELQWSDRRPSGLTGGLVGLAQMLLCTIRVSSETTTPPTNYLLSGELLSLSLEHPPPNSEAGTPLVSAEPLCPVLGAPPVPTKTLYLPPLLFCVWQCFAVRSLGWVEMTEEELAPGRSSVAVNNCIRQLCYHKNNLHDPMSGGWGEVRAWLWGVVLWKNEGNCERWES